MVACQAQNLRNMTVTITQEHEYGVRMQPDEHYIRVSQPGAVLAELLRLVALAVEALGDRFIFRVIEARKGQDSAWIDLHVDPEHQAVVINELRSLPSGAERVGLEPDRSRGTSG